MWDGEQGVKEEDERPLATATSKVPPTEMTDHGDVQVVSGDVMDGANHEEEDTNDLQAAHEAQQQIPQRQPDFPLRGIGKSQSQSSPLHGQDQEVDTDPDFDPLLEGDPHGDSFPCQHCERHFSTRQGLERHIHIHAVSSQQTPLFKCRYCSKAFGSQVGRRRHERRHESGFKKKPGSLAGTAHLLGPLSQTDVSIPDCTGPTSHYTTIGSQLTGGPAYQSETPRKESGAHSDPPFILEENGASKELHPCKYCNKAFGTHTNMRRHQRRIHERHLLPKGVRRKGMLLQEASAQPRPDASPNASPALVYMPSADTEDEADRDDYAVDISKNISENLSFYIDGKIVSTNTVSSCEVIELDTRSAALLGLDTVLIGPTQFSQALKVEPRANTAKQLSNLCQPSSKRRTSTPPLVPSLKVETETAPFTGSSSSTTLSSPNLLVGGLLQQAADSLGSQREKTVYLSPKLKQLLQTQDVQKSITLISESHRLVSPLSVTPLQGPSGRFKRRTASPPSSPQLSPPFKTDGCKAEAVSSYPIKVPKLENLIVSPHVNSLDKDETINLSPCGSNLGQTSSGSGGNACNQQPLDLSNTVNRRSDTSNKVLGDSALDLSLHRKSSADLDLKGSAAPQLQVKKRKPNTSMLEKVLMNEYIGLPLPTEEGPSPLSNLSFQPQSPSIESAHPSPPSLTPVTMNPSSPGTSSVTSATPPPPVLPTMPSPPAIANSPLSQPSDPSAQRALPVLSPKVSPRSPQLPTEDVESLYAGDDKDEEEQHHSETLDSPNTPLQDPLDHPVPLEPSSSVSLSATEDISLTEANSSQLNGETDKDLNSGTPKSENSDLAALSPRPESLPTLPPHVSDDPAPLLLPQSLPHAKIKEEPEHCTDDVSVMTHVPQDDAVPSPQPLENKPDNPPVAGQMDSVYCKTFVCNVCNSPYSSMKELSGHIAEHASAWPFKCEFCLQLFGDAEALLAHRTTLHGVGTIFVCSICSKEFAFLCNLQQHQKDLHPNDACTHTSVESGKLRPQNYTDPSRAKEDTSTPAQQTSEEAPEQNEAKPVKEEPDVNGNHADDGTEDPNEELYTTIKIMASEGGKPKGPDVRLGQNQHYPSYKPPPFPYHSRSHAGSMASATNFTTHNIPQTFTTAIRCTKCGNSFDNMPELHQHILACANASDKKRYTPKKNPIPLKQIVKSPNGVTSPSAGQSAFRRMGQPKRLNFNPDVGKTKMSALSKKKNQLVQKAISQKNKAATSAKKVAVKVEEEQNNVCPHCSREFTYQASLSKHMAVSCPMKPAVKKGNKKPDDKSIRKKDSEMAQMETELKTFGKTRARSSGAAEHPEPPQSGKGRSVQKRPTSFPVATPPASKKAKKGPAQPSPTDLPNDTAAQKPPVKMQRMGKEVPKRLAEPKSPPLQPKKEERFSLRMRERLGGPVTRSSQMAPPAAEAKSEDAPTSEPKDAPEVLMK
ncbi:PR domain zinc finger protein 2 [Syngnathoides biaculeatus]|uniref:PR domain zinc finger protein 2 n=1 Tax=Syngnathoides biaculeatus TaxID=300417 RepID=UPI002ADD6303|nr:PR domain zinc finger protein 2 [Syngnathoides biaculeatus]XP_061688393.1 PR domain zinc finger protein 2 [Syngnathoides biaculeatus]XP_061688394.1 PR domain zinc finger protein 2 [Syngnathoides biaculeatus]XP_061688395.1 PR domain zinc finger protein 2 [Syngnathoides biaculeatus]XP_061688396.1 PR domain zinc finger protein 2 [Syngnathoides biaculeatus]XP_061688397.1 PR domain zinc finger protein 2 [Syngnathoides biaculeatus]XP_061688398.1 PR domain zinc finger protein 2 [Syngnathoides bia